MDVYQRGASRPVPDMARRCFIESTLPEPESLTYLGGCVYAHTVYTLLVVAHGGKVIIMPHIHVKTYQREEW
jgi:hypothetical protein